MGQHDTGDARTKSLREELKKGRQNLTAKEEATIALRQKLRDAQALMKKKYQQMQKRYNPHLIAEDVIALQRNCARVTTRIAQLVQPTSNEAREALKAALAQEEAAGSAVFWQRLLSCLERVVKKKRNEKRKLAAPRSTLEDCWSKVQQARKQIVLEQAKTPILELEAPQGECDAAKQPSRVKEINVQSQTLRDDITSMLKAAAGDTEENRVDRSNMFTTVLVTRFLMDTNKASTMGPVAKIAAPASLFDFKLEARIAPAIPVEADAVCMKRLHRAIL